MVIDFDIQACMSIGEDAFSAVGSLKEILER
jgi:hypothetical protein